MLYIYIYIYIDEKDARTPCCSHTTKCNVNSLICCILFTVRIHKSQSFQSYLVSMIHPFMLLLRSVIPLVIWFQWYILLYYYLLHCYTTCNLVSIIYIYIYMLLCCYYTTVTPLDDPSRSYWLVRAGAAAPRLLYTVRPRVLSGRYFSTRCSQSHVPIIICISKWAQKVS